MMRTLRARGDSREGVAACSLTTEYQECAFANDEERYCEVCGKAPAEAHHWCHTRGAGGGDEPWNILWLCHRHHMEAHAVGRDSFFEQYRGRLPRWRVAQWLERRGDLP